MPCFKPLQAFYTYGLTKNGKRNLFIKKACDPWPSNPDLEPLTLPCSQCIGCRLEHSRSWSIRCVHEASLYEHNCFITLTFDNDNLPKDNSLDVTHFQKFMKRLRKQYGSAIRFYHCGEYGDKFGRPHYHACIFNHDFHDKKPWAETNGNILYRSPSLEKLWPYGFSSIGEVNFASAAYVARYIMKKITGEKADNHYFDASTNTYRKPEYTTMSRRPGIASGWFDQYISDVYPDDFIVLNGKKLRVPRFYDNQYELLYPAEMKIIKASRIDALDKHASNNTFARLKVRETIQQAKLEHLKRGFTPY